MVTPAEVDPTIAYMFPKDTFKYRLKGLRTVFILSSK
jgi:hypothetical protein